MEAEDHMDRPDFPTMEQVESKPPMNSWRGGIAFSRRVTRRSNNRFWTASRSDSRRWAA